MLGSRSRDDRGAVVPMVAILLTVLMVSAAFAVDLGKQRVVRSDMQALADVVALDMARQIRGRTVTQIESDPGWQAALQQSLARNNDTLGDPPHVSVVLGVVSDVTGTFTPVTGSVEPDGVKVTAQGAVDFAFVPGSGSATRTAVAATQPVACFKLGSYALGLDSSNSALLNALVGDALNVTALSYDGLADANISLLGLAAELGVGSVDELLALPGLSLGNFYVAIAEVLSNEGGSSADVQLLQALALAVPALPPVTIGDLLSLAPGADTALDASVNVLDLVATSAFVANGSSFLSVPGLNANLGLTGTSAGLALQIIQKPQLGCGPVSQAKASTSQIALDLGGTLLNPPNILDTTVSVGVTLSVDVASANGTLTDVSCGTFAPGSPDTMKVATQDGLAIVSLQLPITMKLLGVPVLSGTIKVGTTPPAAPSTASMSFPSLSSYSTKYTTGSGNIGLTGLAVDTSDLKLIGLPVGLTLNGLVSPLLTTIVNPLIHTLDASLLTPLLDLLGAQVSGADIWGVPRPDCDASALRG